MTKHGFEIEQMRHQRVQIAGQAQFAPLDKGKQIVGGGLAASNRRQTPASPEIANDAEGVTNGPRRSSLIRPSVMRSSTVSLPISSWQVVFRYRPRRRNAGSRSTRSA